MATTMRYFLVLCASFAVVQCGLKSGLRDGAARAATIIIEATYTKTVYTGNKAHFGPGDRDQIDKTIYFDVPQTVSEAVSFGWKKTARPEGPSIYSTLFMYCSENRMMCTLFDDTDYVCGLQVALEKSRVSNQILDWNIQGHTSWTTDDGKEYWTLQQYFVNEEYLAKSKDDRLASRESNKVLPLDSFWVTGLDKNLIEIPKARAAIDPLANEQSPFTTQACMPGVGQHFFYNMTTVAECTSRGIHPWFILTDSENVIGTSYLTTGKYPVPSGERDWLDARADSRVLRATVPNGPECFYDVDLLTLRIFYVEEPWTITC